jgi:hypothetical protein
MKKVRIVSATSKNETEFMQQTLLGQSFHLLPRVNISDISILFSNVGNNQKGLGSFYNQFLQPEYHDEILLLVHDDVYLHDWHVTHRLNDAIEHFDVIGLAGNINPDFSEPSWALGWNHDKYPTGWQPLEYLSGAVGHLGPNGTVLSYYGETPQSCKLLDGLFLAINAEKFAEGSVRFDEQFKFHFYDLDFCRQCLNKGLTMGTWPISVTHASGGAFGSPAWIDAKTKYFHKWL